jgi:outer membrane protein assembly factor BamD
MLRKTSYHFAAVLAVVILLGGCGIRRHKYDNPIAKDTQQPDKVLYDTAIGDIEHSRFERARLTLQTLMNTYDTSEYLAKAKLAIADSWFREGGGHALAQAEAEYKDFILFYPTMEEAAEAQEKICKMQYNQMDKADRDKTHTLRAEDECRQLLTQFPNSKFAPEAQQYLRNIQEVLAEGEFRVGAFYHTKGSFPAAANRLQGVANQFPLYSHADEALYTLADSYNRMGDKFENQQAAAYARILRDYPLSTHADEAKSRLEAMNRPVPEADPVAYSRMKYELENRTSRSFLAKAWGPFSSRPDMSTAAKSGSPQMEGFRPTIPASVPAVAAGAQGTSDVTAVVAGAGDVRQLDENPDARAPAAQGQPQPAAAPAAGAAPPAAAPQPITITRQGVDINTATEADLAKLPGVGKTNAKRIMAGRPFLSVQDLIRVGIPQKTINRLKPEAATPSKGKTSTSASAATK